MATLRNISQSALSVPALDNRIVDPGEVVETSNEIAAGFAGQDAVWQFEIDDDDPRSLDELRDELRAKGLPTQGRKSQLVARLAGAPAPPAEQPAPEQTVVQNDEPPQ